MRSRDAAEFALSRSRERTRGGGEPTGGLAEVALLLRLRIGEASREGVGEAIAIRASSVLAGWDEKKNEKKKNHGKQKRFGDLREAIWIV